MMTLTARDPLLKPLSLWHGGPEDVGPLARSLAVSVAAQLQTSIHFGEFQTHHGSEAFMRSMARFHPGDLDELTIDALCVLVRLATTILAACREEALEEGGKPESVAVQLLGEDGHSGSLAHYLAKIAVESIGWHLSTKADLWTVTMH